MTTHAPTDVDTAPVFDSATDRIVATRKLTGELRQPRRFDIERPPGPRQRDVWRAVARGDVPSVGFLARFTPYQPIAYVRMPRGDFYFLNDPELIWQVFVTSDVIKGFGLQRARAIIGDGILTSEGAKHRSHRAMVQPAFTGRQIAGYGQQMHAAIHDLDARWSKLSDAGDTRVELVDEMTHLTLDIVGRTLFGLDLAEVSDELAPALGDALEVFNRTLNPSWELLSRYPSKPRRQLTSAVERMDAVVARMIQQKRAALADGVELTDMMSSLITATDPETGAQLDDSEIRDETMTLLLAGHETTSMLLSWTWLLLFQNPQWKDWVAQEWDDTSATTMADVAHLPRTRAVLAEVLRLRPPAWVMDRFTVADLVVGDYVVPRGETVLASQYWMHRDPRYWPDADDFRPDRWLDDAGAFTDKIVPRGVYFPFGFAARKCIGDRFALAESAMALAELGRRWHVIPLDPSAITPHPSVTLRPSTSMPSLLRRR